MNSCILMVEIVEDPQLRYTPDNQSQIAEMLVQFPGLRAEDPPATLKVVAWGDKASEIHNRYKKGDRVAIEGRLTMHTVERHGFKEKRAELVASKIHSLDGSVQKSSTSATPSVPNNVVPLGTRTPASGASKPMDSTSKTAKTPTIHAFPTATPQPPEPSESDWMQPSYGSEGDSPDDIPF